MEEQFEMIDIDEAAGMGKHVLESTESQRKILEVLSNIMFLSAALRYILGRPLELLLQLKVELAKFNREILTAKVAPNLQAKRILEERKKDFVVILKELVKEMNDVFMQIYKKCYYDKKSNLVSHCREKTKLMRKTGEWEAIDKSGESGKVLDELCSQLAGLINTVCYALSSEYDKSSRIPLNVKVKKDEMIAIVELEERLTALKNSKAITQLIEISRAYASNPHISEQIGLDMEKIKDIIDLERREEARHSAVMDNLTKRIRELKTRRGGKKGTKKKKSKRKSTRRKIRRRRRGGNKTSKLWGEGDRSPGEAFTKTKKARFAEQPSPAPTPAAPALAPTRVGTKKRRPRPSKINIGSPGQSKPKPKQYFERFPTQNELRIESRRLKGEEEDRLREGIEDKQDNISFGKLSKL